MHPNATAALVIIVAILLVVIAFKGTQDNWVAALLGHDPSWSRTPAPPAPTGQAALPNWGGPPSAGGGGQVTPGGSFGAPGTVPAGGAGATGIITPGTTTSPPTTTFG